MNEKFLKIIATLKESSQVTLNSLLKLLKEYYPISELFYYSTVMNEKSFIIRGNISIIGNLEPSLKPCYHLKEALNNNKIIRINEFTSKCPTSEKCPFNLFHNQETIKSCIIIPISFNQELKNEFNEMTHCGVLILYAKEKFSKVSDKELYIISKIFSEIHCKSILYDRFKIRSDIFEFSVKSPDINSYFHRTVELLVDKWNFEAISFFVNEERSKLIRLRKTTGLEQKYNKVTDVFYRYNENHLTVDTAINGNEHILIEPDVNNYLGKFSESVNTKKMSCCIFPIKLPPERKYNTKKNVGVLRVINHLYKINNQIIPTPLTWEDIIVCRFLCEMSGAIYFLLEGSNQRNISLERMTHGVMNYINSSIRYLTQLNERSNIETHIPEILKYNLPNTLGNLEAIDWQISKYTTHPSFEITKNNQIVNIFGDVLGEVVASAYKISPIMGIKLSISNLIDAGFSTAPQILGNVELIKLIFKNLIENSMKYCSDKKCKIEITMENINELLIIYFSDYGIGINEKEKEYIFYEGYRSEEAMACNPAGTGFGLFQCSEWINSINGKIELSNCHQPTTFKLSFLKK